MSAVKQSSHLENLNPPQLEAVTHFKGPILVLAGAGSGKTRVLTRRVAHLVLEHNVAPYSILAVTFTNKATEEMRSRLSEMLGPRARQLWVATFHSAGLKVLRTHAHLLGYSNNFAVYDEQDSKGVLKAVLKELAIDEKTISPAEAARMMDQAKNSLILPQNLAEHFERSRTTKYKDPNESLYVEIYQNYQNALMASNAMDFGDLLVNAVLVLQRNKEVLESYRRILKFILVDEFQDTNHVQYTFIKLLSEPRRNLLVVGDDDQSIYAFRGATVKNILEFEKDFPDTRVIKLEQNYRSTGNIIEAANSVISKNTARKEKRLWTECESGPLIQAYCGHDEGEEADFVAGEIAEKLSQGRAPKEIAVFYRVNAQSRALEEALLSAGIPYRIYGGLKFYERKEIKDVIAYLRLILNDSDSQAFLRIVNVPTRGIGAQSVQSVVSLSRQKGCTLFEAAREIAGSSKNIAKFVSIIEALRELAGQHTLSQLISEVLEKTGYKSSLESGKDVAAQSRLENLMELQSIARSLEEEADSKAEVLRLFLDRVSLTSSQELPVEENKDALAEKDAAPDVVSLMTLHLAKGLEFPVVFLTGFEEGLLPHYRSIEENGVEEERRLCYVGMTRAREELYITRAQIRGMFMSGDVYRGSGYFRSVSRFAFEIPPNCMELLNREFFSDEFNDDYLDIEELVEEELVYAGEEERRLPIGKKKRQATTLFTADEIVNRKGDAVREDPDDSGG
ncbi:MAG: UvrD-helicase domain-containing protein [Deltaproteobacteria bacterium]|nr:UvrD-helicase domain-containing protein [Deltaproteobacteria bacterium]